MKVYCVQLQRTAGAYKTIKSFSNIYDAQEYFDQTTQSDPLYNNGNKHHTNRYKIIEEEIQ